MRHITKNQIIIYITCLLISGYLPGLCQNTELVKSEMKILYMVNDKIVSYEKFNSIDPSIINSIEIITNKDKIAAYSNDDYDRCINISLSSSVIRWKTYSIIEDSLMYLSVSRVYINENEPVDMLANFSTNIFSMIVNEDSIFSMTIKYPGCSGLLINNIPIDTDTTNLGDIELIANTMISRKEHDSIYFCQMEKFISTGSRDKKAIKNAKEYMESNFFTMGPSESSPYFFCKSEIDKSYMNCINDKSKNIQINYSKEKNLIKVDYKDLIYK